MSSTYDKRHSQSISAPLEVDSDSDFANDDLIIAAHEPQKLKEGLSRRDTLSIITKKSRGRKPRQPRKYVPNPGHNPLLEYFCTEPDLQPASEGENEAILSTSDNSEEELEEETEGSGSEAELYSGATSQSLAGFGRAVAKGKVQTRHFQHEENVSMKESAKDSATESDSEGEDKAVGATGKRKLTFAPSFYVPNKRVKSSSDLFFSEGCHKDSPQNPSMGTNECDSATESDTGDEVEISQLIFSEAQKPPGSSPIPDTDSATESESEELFVDLKFQPRPGFPLAPGQGYLPPLVLDKDKEVKVPPSLNTYLREYQRDGIRFLWSKYIKGQGGLLGDDMGLGKTIQVIGFLSAIMQKEGDNRDKDRRRVHVSELQDHSAWRKRRELPPPNATWSTCLIIAPSTVVHNWGREFETWGYFEVGLYQGNRKERECVINDFKLGRLDVVVTSFDLARKDIDTLDTLAWSCVIIDEVHRVKNLSSKITQAFHQFTCRCRFGLTGTTIQNSYSEMWTILDWTNPGKLGTPKQWQGYVAKPLTTGQSAIATEEERAKAVGVAMTLKNSLLPNFFLRRTKDIISHQLPKKIDQVVFCPLTPIQIKAYKRLLQMDAVRNLVEKDGLCPCSSGDKRKDCCYPFVVGDVFRYLSILIKLSNHLALILPSPTDTPEQMTRNRTFSEIAFPDGGIPKYGTAMMQPQYCGKWAVLELLLKEWRKDQTNKLLIFTKSVKLLEMLDFHLNTKGKFVDNQTTVGKFELLLGQDIPFSNLMATPNNLIACR